MPRLQKSVQQFFAHSREEWRVWLERNHTTSKGIWLVYNKKTSGKHHLSYDEQVEEALCFGWVDSRPGKLDDERSMLYFAPRKAKSGWSKPNKERVEKLIKAGLMAPAGLAKIEAAKKDGSWTKLDAVERLEVPPDLARALAKVENAEANFAAFPRSVKRAILEWIAQAKKPETRAKRIEETARLAGQNLRANQWRQSLESRGSGARP
ncbi:MAG: YdeI/OmpD-associated family protein [Thermaceae bacterium]|nr:YdeI/OmpD-associated family protein [Thermaceae bacterium]